MLNIGIHWAGIKKTIIYSWNIFTPITNYDYKKIIIIGNVQLGSLITDYLKFHNISHKTGYLLWNESVILFKDNFWMKYSWSSYKEQVLFLKAGVSSKTSKKAEVPRFISIIRMLTQSGYLKPNRKSILLQTTANKAHKTLSNCVFQKLNSRSNIHSSKWPMSISRLLVWSQGS